MQKRVIMSWQRFCIGVVNERIHSNYAFCNIKCFILHTLTTKMCLGNVHALVNAHSESFEYF